MPEMQYGESVQKGDRLQISTVTYDDGGATEVFWARSGDILTMDHEGSFLLNPDGSAVFKCWSGEGSDERPFVVTIMGNRVVVAETEDMSLPPKSETVVFDSHAYAMQPREPRGWEEG